MHRCGGCYILSYEKFFCCNRWASAVLDSAVFMECHACCTLYRVSDLAADKKCHLCYGIMEPHELTVALKLLFERACTDLKASIATIDKSNITDIPSMETLNTMEETYKKAFAMSDGLPSCFEKHVLCKYAQKIKEGHTKWMLIARIFQKLGQHDFLSQIEKVSEYIDSMNGGEHEERCQQIELDDNSDSVSQIEKVSEYINSMNGGEHEERCQQIEDDNSDSVSMVKLYV